MRKFYNMLKMKAVWFILVIALTSLACTIETGKSRHEAFSKLMVKNVHYVKDYRTGICFAVSYVGRTGLMAMVPCNKVKHLLDN